MRTKTLLLTAALASAGLVSSMAQQVFSVNAVGYVNKTLVPGFNLVANPLTASNNTIESLFAGLPDSTRVLKFTGSTFATAQFDELEGSYGANGALTVTPGEGVFVFIPGNQNQTITFVGEVATGTSIVNPIAQGFSIKSSKVPKAGTAEALGLQGADGDKIFQFNESTQQYRTSGYDELNGGWDPALQPLEVGEAFFYFKAAAGTVNWTQSFSVSE
ncbi:MAG: hypothetical protein SFY81_12665 [Verrucomicrobiota bacterium]|nr:hypothetical protein [Verrucomicrobiota bacterium]